MSFSNMLKPVSREELAQQLRQSVERLREDLGRPRAPREALYILPPKLYDDLRALGVVDADGNLDLSKF